MSNKISIGLLAMSLVWLTACHKQRASKSLSENTAADSTLAINATVPADSTLTDSVASVSSDKIEGVTVKKVEFDYLTAKSKVSFKSKSQDFDNTNVNIRIKKDSVIWISVTGVGLEVARGIITPDSIIFMDKIHRDYFVFNYAQLSKQYNFELNFALLQSVIIGNLPFEAQPDGRFVKEKDYYLLKQVIGRLEVDNYISESNLKLAQLKATEIPTQNTFSLDYEDFKEVNSNLFPFSSIINLHVKSAKDQQVNETNMRIKHSKVELVSQSPGFPFKVPSGYKRKR